MWQGSDAASPFCTGTPIFTLAEPGDVDIVCGEYNTGVEIHSLSFELEKVFNVKRIINHPNYQPNRVDEHWMMMMMKTKIFKDGIGQGGPIDGSDISVYHVETDFLLGTVENGVDTRAWIWPVCHPKNESEITGDRDSGMVAAWLDAPPLQLADSSQFGRPGSDYGAEFVLRSLNYPRTSFLQRQDKCQDPENQRARGVNTFYPEATTCYVDPSFGNTSTKKSTARNLILCSFLCGLRIVWICYC